MNYTYIIAEKRGQVGLLRLNRPKALNALSSGVIAEIGRALAEWERDSDIGAIVVTGSDKAFAAGADVTEMLSKNYADAYVGNFITEGWEELAHCRKPTLAAVAGFALGGGCELAMMCDIIIAADNARFGQPEINLGIIPGAGGTQRLVRAIGKSKAMEMCLSGRMMGAEEAERSGLAALVVPVAELVDKALEIASAIAAKSRPVALMTKECVNAAFETTLSQGILFERRNFHACFALSDQKEGMAAFVEKRKPNFSHS